MMSSTLSPWFSRLIIAAVTVLFTVIGLKFVIDPTTAAAGSGLSFASAVGYTTARAGIGGFPLSIAAILVFCLLSRRRHLAGLGVIATVGAVILIIRLFSAMLDGTLAQSMHIIGPEIGIVVLSFIAIRLERVSGALPALPTNGV